MITTGQATYLHTNINSFIGIAFVASYGLGIGLVLWYAFNLTNPIAELLVKTMTASVGQ